MQIHILIGGLGFTGDLPESFKNKIETFLFVLFLKMKQKEFY
jgi:hypothetical protein